MEGQTTHAGEPFPPASTATWAPNNTTTTAIPSATLSLLFSSEGKEGGGWELVGDAAFLPSPSLLACTYQYQCSLLGRRCSGVGSKTARSARRLRSHAATLTKPRGTSRGRLVVALVVHQSPFPSRNGNRLARRACVELGVREIPIGKGAILLKPGFGPALLSLCLLLRCCFSTTRPRKNKGGHGPAPVTAQVVPSPLPVSVPVPVPVRSHHLDFVRLAKAVNQLSYRGVACPGASIPKTRFLPAQNPPPSPPSARLRSSPLLRALRSYS